MKKYFTLRGKETTRLDTFIKAGFAYTSLPIVTTAISVIYDKKIKKKQL